jgi:small-conductance mechanosensitive channel
LIASGGVRARPASSCVRRIGRHLGLLAAALLLAGSASSQPPQPPAAQPPPAEKAEEKPPGPIPIPEIAIRSEQDTNLVRGLETGLATDAVVDAIARELPGIVDAQVTLVDDTNRMLEQGPRRRVVETLEASWQTAREQATSRNESLTKRADAVEAAIGRLARLREEWQRTAEAARESRAPQTLVERVRSTIAQIDASRKSLENRLTTILELQARVVNQISVADSSLTQIAAYRKEVIGQLLLRDSRPIWRAMAGGASATAFTDLVEDFRVGGMLLAGYLKENPARLVGQLGLLLAFVWLFRSARERSRRASEQEPDLTQAAVVFQVPYSAALLLALVSMYWLHPHAPLQLRQVTALLALFPVLRVARPLLDPALAPGLKVLGAFFVVDRLRDLFATSPLAEQILFLLEMLTGVALMVFVLRPRRLEGVELTAEQGAALRPLGVAARILLAVFSLALVAGATGYGQLAHLVGESALLSAYAALAFYTSARAAGALLTFALHSRRLSRLRFVSTHRAILRQRLQRLLPLLAALGWLYVTLNTLGIREIVIGAALRTLDASLSFGTLTISLRNLLAFAATVAAAFLISRLLRFLLEEDVYPRVTLARGVPYAVSSLLHYVILFAGFVLAIFALGFDLTRVTILAGAFGVGIGFGLQNVVNNFVSGLIMLFERPMKLGDTVQIADVTGTVERIGIRSSTLRTFEGAEVVVPNATLISDRLTNWTLSNLRRRIDLKVGVAYGTEPKKMLDLLISVARANRDVLAYPPPMALFNGFGESSLDFELRVWTDDYDQWVRIRSELGVELHGALSDAGIEVPFPQRVVRVLPEG